MADLATLADACEAIVDCAHKTAPIDVSGGYFAVGTPAMRGNVINYAEARPISQATFDEWTSRLRPRIGDLLLAREAPVGPVVRIPKAENVAPGQRTVLLRPAPGVVDADFLYFYLTSPAAQSALAVKASGSTVPHLNVADVRQLPMPDLPALPQQRAIASVLGALDDKIAANARILTLSDEVIRARLGALKGPTVPLGKFASHVRIQVDPVDVAGDKIYVGLEHIPRRLMWLSEHGRADSVSSAKARFERGDVLFGKLRPYFHKVVHAPAAGIASTDIVVIRANAPELRGFVLACASSERAVRATSAASEGTRMPRTKWADLAAVEFPWPSDGEVLALSDEVGRLSDCTAALVRENDRLAATRDELLPQLMSGRITVHDAEEVVEAAT